MAISLVFINCYKPKNSVLLLLSISCELKKCKVHLTDYFVCFKSEKLIFEHLTLKSVTLLKTPFGCPHAEFHRSVSKWMVRLRIWKFNLRNWTDCHPIPLTMSISIHSQCRMPIHNLLYFHCLVQWTSLLF